MVVSAAPFEALCAVGVMRMLSTNDPSSSTRAGTGDDAEHNRALTYGRILSGLGVGWVRLVIQFLPSERCKSTC